MKPSIASKLAQLSARLEELNALLSSEDVTRNLENYRKLTREHAEISPVVELYHAYTKSERDVVAAQEMANDPEMRELAEAEVRQGRQLLADLEADLQKQLLPKDSSGPADGWVRTGARLYPVA